jgi:hypothetical protein
MKPFALVAVAAAAALGLAGCEDGAPEQKVTKVVAANPHSDQLKGMSELYRNLGLKRAIADNGRRCRKVERGGYQQQYKTMAMWAVHCDDTGDWAVYIAPDGTVQVSPCRDARQLGLPECRVPAAASPTDRQAAPKKESAP